MQPEDQAKSEYVPFVPPRKPSPRRLPMPAFADGHELRDEWYEAFKYDKTRKLYGVR